MEEVKYNDEKALKENQRIRISIECPCCRQICSFPITKSRLQATRNFLYDLEICYEEKEEETGLVLSISYTNERRYKMIAWFVEQCKFPWFAALRVRKLVDSLSFS